MLIDGGVRRGSDIVKALCLGARGVGLGRPFLYAQTAYGEQGVMRAVDSESSFVPQLTSSDLARGFVVEPVSK